MSNITLGIIGGGQLGSMLAIAAKKLNIKTVVFFYFVRPTAGNVFDANFEDNRVVKSSNVLTKD